jgi:GcrA cell cycle regulator
MGPTNWSREHCDALREFHARGLSFAEIAEAINAKFKTDYSRNAAIGRAKRMGLADLDRPKSPPIVTTRRVQETEERRAPSFPWPTPVLKPAKTPKLRCVDIDPRHLSLIDLEPGDCRYPYGGDEEGEAITFCGHPQRLGSSYCTAHFHLSRGPGTVSERMAIIVALRLVEAA